MLFCPPKIGEMNGHVRPKKEVVQPATQLSGVKKGPWLVVRCRGWQTSYPIIWNRWDVSFRVLIWELTWTMKEILVVDGLYGDTTQWYDGDYFMSQWSRIPINQSGFHGSCQPRVWFRVAQLFCRRARRGVWTLSLLKWSKMCGFSLVINSLPFFGGKCC